MSILFYARVSSKQLHRRANEKGYTDLHCLTTARIRMLFSCFVLAVCGLVVEGLNLTTVLGKFGHFQALVAVAEAAPLTQLVAFGAVCCAFSPGISRGVYL